MQIGSVNRRMTIRALRVEIESRGRRRVGAEMKFRHDRVATDTELGNPLVFQQVSVRRPVRGMACRAALDAGRGVLEYERAALIGMAIRAQASLEPPEQAPRRGLMTVVAGNALEHAFDQTVVLVQLECSQLILMAVEAEPAGSSDSVLRPEQAGHLP